MIQAIGKLSVGHRKWLSLLVGIGGIEPPTADVSDRNSDQTELYPLGGGTEIRTRGPPYDDLGISSAAPLTTRPSHQCICALTRRLELPFSALTRRCIGRYATPALTFSRSVVPKAGLEPARPKAPDFKSGMAAGFITRATTTTYPRGDSNSHPEGPVPKTGAAAITPLGQR